MFVRNPSAGGTSIEGFGGLFGGREIEWGRTKDTVEGRLVTWWMSVFILVSRCIQGIPFADNLSKHLNRFESKHL